jgi:hypothetical protein
LGSTKTGVAQNFLAALWTKKTEFAHKNPPNTPSAVNANLIAQMKQSNIKLAVDAGDPKP